jgi:hypothetical protein
MLILIAGTSREAHDWADDNNLNPANYKVIYDYVQMLGIRPDNNDIELIGTWEDNELMVETVDRLLQTEWRHILRRKLSER